MKLGHLYTVLFVTGKDFKDIGKEAESPEKVLQRKLETILKLADPSFVDKVFARNETTTNATIRLMDPRKRKKIVAINKKVVEKVYSQSAIVKQIHKVITADE